jgi:hypothetical protein
VLRRRQLARVAANPRGVIAIVVTCAAACAIVRVEVRPHLSTLFNF